MEREEDGERGGWRERRMERDEVGERGGWRERRLERDRVEIREREEIYRDGDRRREVNGRVEE